MVFARWQSPRPLTLHRRVSMTTYSSDKAVPYVYICTHKETNQFYIGYREANVRLNRPSHLDLPEYKTSSKIINPDWENYTWFILAEFFDPSHAYSFEQQLICDNWDNPLMLNGHCNIGKNQFRVSGPSPLKGKPSPLKGKPNGKKGKPSGRKGIHTGQIPWNKGIPAWNKGISAGPQQNPSGPRGPQQNPSGPRGPQTKVKCPHCGKDGGINNMTRYHFDNCKKKPVDQ